MPDSSLTTTGKIESMLGDLRKLPLMPATAQQAMALASNDAASIHEFARLIERDVTLAASILKLANSPVFSWGRTIESLDQAVVRLGLRECQNLLVAVSMRNLFSETNPRTKALCAILWRHCFLAACLCRRLNQQLHLEYQGEEFTAALLHDLGRILLAVKMPDKFAEVDPLDFVEGPGTLEHERHGFGADHCQVGCEYAMQNGLPAPAITAIRHHHAPSETREHRGLLGLVVTADHIANYLQRGEEPSKYDLSQNPGFSFLAHGWPTEKIASVKRFVPTLLSDAERMASGASSSKSAGRPASASAGRAASHPNEEKSSVWSGIKSWLGG